jgi:hypothetical protein
MKWLWRNGGLAAMRGSLVSIKRILTVTGRVNANRASFGRTYVECLE